MDRKELTAMNLADELDRLAGRQEFPNGATRLRWAAAALRKSEEWRRDAERYRWLRDLPLGSTHESIGNMPGDMWDAAIDAARKEGV